jgi:TonB family protein
VSKRTDISQQIKKYLNGELDARAMHKFERQAQADPFLRDALEGYELSGADHNKNLDELASRLKDRIAKKERRIIPFRFIATAASILLFLFAGILWYLNRPTEQEKQVVKVKLAPEIKKTKIDTLLITEKKTEIATLTKKAPPRTIIAHDDAVQQNNIAQNTSSSPNADINIDAPVGNSDAKVTEMEPNKPQDSLNSRRTAKDYNNNLSGRIAGIGVNNIIKGIVKDEMNHPIPGATVMIKGTNKTTVTDVNGKFVLPDVSSYSTLNIAYIGYNNQQIAVNKRDSLVIAMQPNTTSLNEVVVVGYGVKKQDDDQQLYEAAQPANGWSDFKKYLKDNAKSPDGKSGVVKVSFTVNEYGTLSDFKIKKSLSAETDNAAIQLIQAGPRWITNSNRKPEVVKVSVKFVKPQ